MTAYYLDTIGKWIAPVMEGAEVVGQMNGKTKEQAEARAALAAYALTHMQG